MKDKTVEKICSSIFAMIVYAVLILIFYCIIIYAFPAIAGDYEKLNDKSYKVRRAESERIYSNIIYEFSFLEKLSTESKSLQIRRECLSIMNKFLNQIPRGSKVPDIWSLPREIRFSCDGDVAEIYYLKARKHSGVNDDSYNNWELQKIATELFFIDYAKLYGIEATLALRDKMGALTLRTYYIPSYACVTEECTEQYWTCPPRAVEDVINDGHY